MKYLCYAHFGLQRQARSSTVSFAAEPVHYSELVNKPACEAVSSKTHQTYPITASGEGCLAIPRVRAHVYHVLVKLPIHSWPALLRFKAVR